MNLISVFGDQGLMSEVSLMSSTTLGPTFLGERFDRVKAPENIVDRKTEIMVSGFLVKPDQIEWEKTASCHSGSVSPSKRNDP